MDRLIKKKVEKMRAEWPGVSEADLMRDAVADYVKR